MTAAQSLLATLERRKASPSPIPLSRAALCIECEAVFLIAQTCPACASEFVMALETWLGSVRPTKVTAGDSTA